MIVGGATKILWEHSRDPRPLFFGHTDYCMEPTNLEAEAVASRVTAMLDESAALRNDLAGRIPGVQRSALSAGMGLKHLIGVK